MANATKRRFPKKKKPPKGMGCSNDIYVLIRQFQTACWNQRQEDCDQIRRFLCDQIAALEKRAKTTNSPGPVVNLIPAGM